MRAGYLMFPKAAFMPAKLVYLVNIHGIPTVRNALVNHRTQITPYRIRTLRKKLNLRCKQKLRFKVTTNSKHHLPVAPNILKREFAVNAPGKVWVSDITYIPTNESWLYLVIVKDLFNRELVGYAMNERMNKDLVIQVLFRATASKHPIGSDKHLGFIMVTANCQ